MPAKKTITKPSTTVGTVKRRAQLTAEAKDDPVAKANQNSALAPLSAGDATKRAREAGDDIVDVVVPHAFNLTLADYTVVQYTEATRRMPLSHAEHWYAKAQGVTLVED